METLSVLDYHNSGLVRKTIDEGCSGINIKALREVLGSFAR